MIEERTQYRLCTITAVCTNTRGAAQIPQFGYPAGKKQPTFAPTDLETIDRQRLMYVCA
jgi:hypothetical protein